ncbi:hypothetical protein [Chitinivibrio alkaliphilus]|uniref:Uncharacterized protein n=1 Tax=Chitinivibrio alkaliphilus ACht1 TaxID=1313304 RepID=U7D700_9BACT|nr:hypothetical protein [Chitinivibrio alkaliphilus]ERP31723.1 hypothetical protein CALK_1386 [Chitinivibrio alkaliphilus ACht1]
MSQHHTAIVASLSNLHGLLREKLAGQDIAVDTIMECLEELDGISGAPAAYYSKVERFRNLFALTQKDDSSSERAWTMLFRGVEDLFESLGGVPESSKEVRDDASAEEPVSSEGSEVQSPVYSFVKKHRDRLELLAERSFDLDLSDTEAVKRVQEILSFFLLHLWILSFHRTMLLSWLWKMR